MISISCSTRFSVPALVFLLCVGVAVPTPFAAESEPDTLVVRGIREALGIHTRSVIDQTRIEQILLGSPFRLIRRGTGTVSDLYVDGMKRGDIAITIDGERYTTACPNRMDTRVGQMDLLEIESVKMSRGGASLQSGLAGQVDFRRRSPGSERRLNGRMVGSFENADEYEGSFSWEQHRMRFGARIRLLSPYTDADGGTFVDRYGYADEFDTEIHEVRAHAAHDRGDVYLAYESSSDVLFPYLLMDERENDHVQVSGSWGGHRIYFNHTKHLMDNALRRSHTMTDMVTDAQNTHFGAVGRLYDLQIRHWDADNRITPVTNPALEKNNRMLPDVWRMGATFRQQVGVRNDPWLIARAGLVRTWAGDKSVQDLYRVLEPNARTEHWSVPVGLTMSKRWSLSGKSLFGVALDGSTAPAGIEQLFIATDKPGTKPDWVGNPKLPDPARLTLRVAWQQRYLQCEIFGSRVWNYTYLVKRKVEGAMYQTYDGVDAWLAGTNALAHWRWFETGVQWNWGEKVDTKKPLAEMQPVSLHLAAEKSYQEWTGRVVYRHAAGQGRIDPLLDETPTGAWNRLDLELSWKRPGYRLAIEAWNVTNVLYSQHLSYLRSPFASGERILEPGRVFRLTFGFEQ